MGGGHTSNLEFSLKIQKSFKSPKKSYLQKKIGDLYFILYKILIL